jgi:hypothetical protein
MDTIIDNWSTKLVRAFAPRPANDESKPKLSSGARAFGGRAGQLERSSDTFSKGSMWSSSTQVWGGVIG